jgi:tetratricopeptide (TPR) repeat protein
MVERDPLFRPAYVNLNFTYLRLHQLEKMKALQDRLRPIQGDESRFQILMSLYYNAKGDFSAALPFARAAHDALPDEYYHVSALARTYTWLNDWEGVLTLNLQDAEFKAIALDQLDRTEEASITARKWFETTGRPLGLFQHLVFNESYEALMTLVEQHWGGVEAFHAAALPVLGFGHRNLLFVAAASRETGREQAFQTAMGLIREEHDRQRSQGIDWYPFHYYEAIYWTLAGDLERAVDHVERMVERDGYLTPRFSDLMPLLKPLEGLPRYEVAQALALDQLNRERVEAGYAPLDP